MKSPRSSGSSPSSIPVYQVDAFSSQLFKGNPAAVCLLESWLPDPLLQAIAAENNLSETAFLLRGPENDSFELRWFTPTVEVQLCGHATLASAYVIFRKLSPQSARIGFQTRSGKLWAWTEGVALTIDLPSTPLDRLPRPNEKELSLLRQGLRLEDFEVLGKAPGLWVIQLSTAQAVRELKPDFGKLSELKDCVSVTAPGTGGTDFVSRYFAPNYGIPEDPVTGSAHCVLAPYWAARLGKTALRAQQLSPRGGSLVCRVRDARVELTGEAALYLDGVIHLP